MKKASLPKSSSNFVKFILGTLSVGIFVFLDVSKPAQLLAQTVPSGFYKILEDKGVRVYKKDYQGGQPDYVTVVDLRRATIRNLTGSNSNGNVYRKLLSNFWNDAVAMNSTTAKAKVVINGTFFKNNNNGSPNPTTIAFGLKVRNNKISYGYAVGSEFSGLIRTFSFNSFGASSSIKSHSKSTFDSPTPDVVGALDVTADKTASNFIPRTFVGNIDSDRNGAAETILLFSTAYGRQVAADNVLKAFGATSRAMLDGGGSTGLIIDGSAYIPTTRTVPHAIAVYAGKPENAIKGIGNKCLDVSGGNTASGTPIQIWDCNGTAAQKWSFTDGVLRGIAGKCLDVSGSNTANGTKIQIWDCNGTAAQKWTFVKDSVFRGIGGKCLDVSGGNTASGTKLQLWDCNNSAAQSWQRID
jgi:Ricin-type beta-trefoil lectin domain